MDNFKTIYNFKTMVNFKTEDNFKTMDDFKPVDNFKSVDNFNSLVNFKTMHNFKRTENFKTVDNFKALGNFKTMVKFKDTGSFKTVDNFKTMHNFETMDNFETMVSRTNHDIRRSTYLLREPNEARNDQTTPRTSNENAQTRTNEPFSTGHKNSSASLGANQRDKPMEGPVVPPSAYAIVICDTPPPRFHARET
uniref:Uncharacterized protein n=1 Tax=Trichuris muris TaxID=70415 RepID=A0A5S6Q351_TRIMR